MAISDSSKIDLLYKKLFGVAKTDTPTAKSPNNETIASPPLLRGDKIWTSSGSIPTPTPPSSTNAYVQVYQTTARVEATADLSSNLISGVPQTWKTSLTDWIPQEFGANYAIKAYIAPTGTSDPSTTGVRIYQDGDSSGGEFFFDYQAGTLNFISGSMPSTFTSTLYNSPNNYRVFIYGYRYIGAFGIPSSSYTASNTATGNTVALRDNNGNLGAQPFSGDISIVNTSLAASTFLRQSDGSINAAGNIYAQEGNVYASDNVTAYPTTSGGGALVATGQIITGSTATDSIKTSGGLTMVTSLGGTAILKPPAVGSLGNIYTLPTTSGTLATGDVTTVGLADSLVKTTSTGGIVTTGSLNVTSSAIPLTVATTPGASFTGGYLATFSNVFDYNTNLVTIDSTGTITAQGIISPGQIITNLLFCINTTSVYAGTTAGAIERDNNKFYGTTTAVSGRGLIPAIQKQVLTGNSSAATTTTLVNVFPTTPGLPIEAAKLYYFKATYHFNTTFTSGTAVANVAFTFTNAPGAIKYTIRTYNASTANSALEYNAVRNTAAASTATAAFTASRNSTAEIEGYFTSNSTTGGTMIPQFSMSTTGSSTVVSQFSTFEIQKIGTTGTQVIAGAWA